jgi:hypothetical protein
LFTVSQKKMLYVIGNLINWLLELPVDSTNINKWLKLGYYDWLLLLLLVVFSIVWGGFLTYKGRPLTLDNTSMEGPKWRLLATFVVCWQVCSSELPLTESCTLHT